MRFTAIIPVCCVTVAKFFANFFKYTALAGVTDSTYEAAAAAATVARARTLPLIRQVPLWPVVAAAAAGTAVFAATPVSVLCARAVFGERNRVTGAVVSIWFSVSHCQCVRSAATVAVCARKIHDDDDVYFRVYGVRTRHAREIYLYDYKLINFFLIF